MISAVIAGSYCIFRSFGGKYSHEVFLLRRAAQAWAALMADAGMRCDHDSVIEVDEPLYRHLTGIATGRFTPAEGEATLSGIAIETDPGTGLVAKQSPLRVGGSLAQVEPAFPA